MQKPCIDECDEGEAAIVEPEELHSPEEKLLDSLPNLEGEIEKGSGSVKERDLYSSGVPKSPPRSTELLDPD